jgi:signal transduction histidine kinase
LGEQVLIGNPILVVAFLFAAFQFLKTPRSQQVWFSLSASLPILLVICSQALLSRAHANWAAPAYLGVCLLAFSYLRLHARKLIALAFFFNIIFAALLYHYQDLVAKPLNLKGTQSSDPFWAIRNWPQINELVAHELRAELPHAQWRVASEDRAVLAQLQMSQNLAPGQALGWQRKAAPDNHFDLHFPLTSELKQPVLLVTQVSREEVLHDYPQAIWVKVIRADVMPVDPLSYQLWWLNK